MKKLTISANNRFNFLDYADNRIKRSSKEYNHITQNILIKTYDFFTSHELTAQENGSTYWKDNGKKIIESYGYSGFSQGTIDDLEAMQENLYHEVFCKAEWIARSETGGYSDVCKTTIGSKAFKEITA